MAFPAVLFAQDSKDTVVEQKIQELTSVWKQYNSLSSQDFTFTGMGPVHDLLDRSSYATDTTYNNYLAALHNANMNSVKDDYGLRVTGNIADNFKSPVVIEDNIIYRTRVQAGVDWDIFKEGYYGTKIKMQKEENDYLLQKLEHEQQNRSDLFVDKYARVLYMYNIQKIKVLEKRREINARKLDLARQLNILKEIPYVDVIQVDQAMTDIDGMFMVYKSYNDLVSQRISMKDLPGDPFPLVDLDFQELSSRVVQLQSDQRMADSIIALKIKDLELQMAPVNSISLTASLKYNYYYIDQSVGSRDFVSVGVGFSMPFPLGKKNDIKRLGAEEQLLKYESKSAVKQDAYEELLNTVYEYRYKLKQYMNFSEKRVRYRELLRVERVKEQFGDEEFNPLTALNLLDELLAVNVEMLDLQQQMYLQLLKIADKYPGLEISGCIKPFSLPEASTGEQKMNTSVYIWSSAFDDYSNNYIAEYLLLNHVNHVIVSVRKNGANATRTSALIDTLAQRGITCEMMTGNNDLLKKDVKPFIDSLLSGMNVKNITGIHLDVEPHTLKDYKANEQKYLQQYVNMVKAAAEYCKAKGIKLSVSIPLYYPEDVLKDIYANCDKVYLMAYEKPDLDFIQKKTTEEFALGKDKTVIALRAEDFATRHDMEVFMAKLSDKLKTDRFALHDLSRMISLDQDQLKNNKEDER
jgi:hypothetical protein